MKTNAYAKINLYLDVMDRTPEGFHNIKSVMHSVSLCDCVSAERGNVTGQHISVICDKGHVPSGEKNIVWKAAKAFFEYFGIKDYDVAFVIEKHIPMAAGLAGGSTDAGAAIKLLNELFGVGADLDTLLKIGASVGSDVPFCMLGGTALCTGRGEVMEKLDSKLRLTFVIAKGGEGVSTPAAYRMIDEKYGDNLAQDFASVELMLRAVENGDTALVAKALYNTFESVVLPTHAKAREAKALMLSSGAECAMLSGSGPSVFGVFGDTEKAEGVCEKLKFMGYDASVCRSIC